MSKNPADRLYKLMPSIYRQRDLVKLPDEKGPLYDLLAIMEQVQKILENDIDNLYENWFIETCDEWVPPYIGDLVGASLLQSVKEGASVGSRPYVANTLKYRKGKGTVAVMEEIAHDVTGWDAHAVEFFQLLSWTQNFNHPRPWSQWTPNIRDPEPVDLVGTAFDPVPHTLDVRSIAKGHGYYNVPNLGVFLWRLTAYPVKEARAFAHGVGKYSFSQLGLDAPLFNHPLTAVGALGAAEEINVSTPVRMLAMKKKPQAYYRKDLSILVEIDGNEVPAAQVVVCDLSGWDDANFRTELPDLAKKAQIAIDPVLGRLILPDEAKHNVFVTYYYGFSADMGGGFYKRDRYKDSPEKAGEYLISRRRPDQGFDSVAKALKKWVQDGKPDAVFEILDSETYDEGDLTIGIPRGKTLVVRAAQAQRPTLRGKQAARNQAVYVDVTGEEDSRLVLDGLLIDKNVKVRVKAKLGFGDHPNEESNLSTLYVQHCSLVPPTGKGDSILVETNDYVTVTLKRTICGGVNMETSQGTLAVTDSIVDKTAQGYAVECYDASIINSTIFGKTKVEKLTLASNVIFSDTVLVKRRQQGCVRFSYVAHRFSGGPDRSRVPQCFRCQPDSETSLVVPQFSSQKYGSPWYGQLSKHVAKEIFSGADNESEIGAFNYIYQSQRINNLLATFREYLPFRLEAGVILVT
jgi:hypothetical protein